MAWFREKAREFERIAAQLDATFAAASPAQKIAAAPAEKAPVTKEIIEELLHRRRAARAAELADRLEVEPEEIRVIIARHPETFLHTGRGWIKLASP